MQVDVAAIVLATHGWMLLSSGFRDAPATKGSPQHNVVIVLVRPSPLAEVGGGRLSRLTTIACILHQAGNVFADVVGE